MLDKIIFLKDLVKTEVQKNNDYNELEDFLSELHQ